MTWRDDNRIIRIVHPICCGLAVAVKDRLLGHNPLAAIYTIYGYYRSLKIPIGQE